MSDLNDLMDKDPLELSSQDIDAIIAYHRNHRANLAAGIKTKKDTGPKVSLGSVLDHLLVKPTLGLKRRV